MRSQNCTLYFVVVEIAGVLKLLDCINDWGCYGTGKTAVMVDARVT